MATAQNLVNKFGKMTGWNNVVINLLGRDVVGILSLEYDDESEDDNAYGQGDMPVGFGTGNYKAKVAIELYVEEVNAIQKVLPPGSRIQDIAPFDILVEYVYQGMKYKDRIRNCRFKGRGIAVKQGDKTIANKPPMNLSHIDWNIV